MLASLLQNRFFSAFALPRIGRVVALLLALAVVCGSRSASAWVEATIKADSARVTVERDGSAIVEHEILVRLRGSAVRSFTIEGVDPDAEPLPNATVTRASSGQAAGHPIPVTAVADEGRIALGVEYKKGIGGGTFLFRFAYRTQFLTRNLITPRDDRAELRWVGPRFNDGIDSVRVVFSLPRAPIQPSLPDMGPDGVAALSDEYDGVFLSTLRRQERSDELEVVRPHVARGEPVVWRVLADASLFGLAQPAVAESASENPPAAVPAVVAVRSTATLVEALVVFAVIVLLSLLATLKAVLVRRASLASAAESRPFVRLDPPYRLLALLCTLSAASSIVLLTEHTTLGALVFVVAMALVAHLPPMPIPPLRKPGSWKAITDAEAFAPQARVAPVPGGWVDVGRLKGFLLFALLTGGALFGTARLFTSAPTQAVLLLFAAALLFPLFCTGRAAELPPDPVLGSRVLLSRIARALRRGRVGAQIFPMVRFAEGETRPDELRLCVRLERPLPGLVSVELAVEYQSGFGRAIEMPVAIVRALEGSPSQLALPPGIEWVRGREASERACVLRPKLPSRSVFVGLCSKLVTTLSADARLDAGRSRRAGVPGGRHSGVRTVGPARPLAGAPVPGT